METENPACIDEEQGREVFRWSVMEPIGLDVPQDATLAAHVAACPYCHKSLPVWRIGKRLATARSIIEASDRGDPKVTSRKAQGKTIYFSRGSSDANDGLLVATDETGEVLSIRLSSVIDFERA